MVRRTDLTPEYVQKLLGNGIIVPRPKSSTNSVDEALLTPEVVEDMRQRMNEQFAAKPPEADD